MKNQFTKRRFKDFEDVARYLGLELGEEFKVEDYGDGIYRFEKDGLYINDYIAFATCWNLFLGKEKIVKTPFIPKESQFYYTASLQDGKIHKKTFMSSDYDKAMLIIGNCFRTERDAELSMPYILDILHGRIKLVPQGAEENDK